MIGYGSCFHDTMGPRSEPREREMRKKDDLHRNEPFMQRVRCRHCRLPLVQLYQGDLLYTLQNSEGERTSQPVPAYAYRTLTDPTPLLFCPRCDAALSPAAVMVITFETRVTEEGKEASHSRDT